MSQKESSPEMASLAGRIVAGGNPLQNEQVIAVLNRDLPDAIEGNPQYRTDRVLAVMRTVFEPYFENMLSLAGSVLAQAQGGEGRLRPMLYECLGRFSEYERLHVKKGTPQGLAKAAANAEIAARVEAVLADEAEPQLSPLARMMGLLKGQAPAGVAGSALHRAAGAEEDSGEALAIFDGGWMVLREGKLFATDKLVACPAVVALPWPVSE